MYKSYPQQQQPGYQPQQPSHPIVGAGAAPTMAPQNPYGQQPFQPQFQQGQYQQPSGQQYQSMQQQFQSPQQQAPTQPTHPDRESYQTALPANVTPGWNDPPSMLPSAGTTPNRLSNMRRRPVDPSISGNVGYGTSSQTSNPYGASASPYGAPQQNPQQYQEQPQSYQTYQQPQQQQPQYGQQQNPQQFGQQYPGAGAPHQQQHYGM